MKKSPTPKKKAKPTKPTPSTKPTKKTTPPPKKSRTRKSPKPKTPAQPRIPDESSFDAFMSQAASSFPEPRFYGSSSQLLGYLEGRPGVIGINTAAPARAGEVAGRPWTREQRDAIGERLDETPLAETMREERSESEYAKWRRQMMDVLRWADDGGVLVEAEVDSDSGPAEEAA